MASDWEEEFAGCVERLRDQRPNQSYRWGKGVGLVWNQWLLRVPVTAVLRASSEGCTG